MRKNIKSVRNETIRYIRGKFPFGSLPNVLIIGAMKSGTTSLRKYLLKSSKVCSSLTQEVHFFDDKYEKGISWYRSNFPVLNGRKTLDTTPSYMFKEVCLERIYKTVPNAKMIAVLRKPIERTISHYKHSKRNGEETRDFRSAIEEDINMIEKRGALGRNDYYDKKRAYVRKSLYHPQLKRFDRKHEENLLVIKTSDLKHRRRQTMKKVFSFISINEKSYNYEGEYNKSSNKMNMSSSDVNRLKSVYKSYNKRLERDFGIEFS